MTARARELLVSDEEQADPPGTPVLPMPCFQVVYEEHFDFVWRSLRALGVPESAIDDAVQDLFLVVHRRLAEFEGRSSLRSWLFGIARKVALRELRNKQREARGEELDDARVESPTPNPRELAQRQQASNMLLQLLDTLDDDKRAVFVLVELEQMGVPDAAATLGWNINTTYSRLRLARIRIRRAAGRLNSTMRSR